MLNEQEAKQLYEHIESLESDIKVIAYELRNAKREIVQLEKKLFGIDLCIEGLLNTIEYLETGE